MTNAQVGAKLRHQRHALKLTLEDVAARANCSESMISKIETGHVNPSLNLLHRIADSLEINMATLFSSDLGNGVVSRSGARPQIRTGGRENGKGIVIEQLVPHEPGALLQANMHFLEPGGSVGDAISHTGHEMGYILSGEVELMIEGETWILRENDSFHFDSDRKHAYRNVGSTPAQMIIINTPPSF